MRFKLCVVMVLVTAAFVTAAAAERSFPVGEGSSLPLLKVAAYATSSGYDIVYWTGDSFGPTAGFFVRHSADGALSEGPHALGDMGIKFHFEDLELARLDEGYVLFTSNSDNALRSLPLHSDGTPAGPYNGLVFAWDFAGFDLEPNGDRVLVLRNHADPFGKTRVQWADADGLLLENPIVLDAAGPRYELANSPRMIPFGNGWLAVWSADPGPVLVHEIGPDGSRKGRLETVAPREACSDSSAVVLDHGRRAAIVYAAGCTEDDSAVWLRHRRPGGTYGDPVLLVDLPGREGKIIYGFGPPLQAVARQGISFAVVTHTGRWDEPRTWWFAEYDFDGNALRDPIDLSAGYGFNLGHNPVLEYDNQRDLWVIAGSGETEEGEAFGRVVLLEPAP